VNARAVVRAEEDFWTGTAARTVCGASISASIVSAVKIPVLNAQYERLARFSLRCDMPILPSG